MNEVYDSFPVNLLEVQGKISRKGFTFLSRMAKVWFQGQCIKVDSIDGVIKAEIEDSMLIVTLSNMNYSEYIYNKLSFEEISLNKDRVLWSNGLLDGGNHSSVLEPDFLSLFYCRGELVKVQFSNSVYLIEFYK